MADNPHTIPLKDAAALTARWRQNMPPDGFNAARFDRVAFDTLLAQKGCEGIRIYMGMQLPGAKDYPSTWTFVMVGTDASGNDMTGTGTTMADGSAGNDGDVEEEALPCPPYCDVTSPLNGGGPPP